MFSYGEFDSWRIIEFRGSYVTAGQLVIQSYSAVDFSAENFWLAFFLSAASEALITLTLTLTSRLYFGVAAVNQPLKIR